MTSTNPIDLTEETAITTGANESFRFMSCRSQGSTWIFEIAGRPLSKRRPGQSKSGHRYNPNAKHEKDFRNALSWGTRNQLEGFTRHGEDVLLVCSITFHFKQASYKDVRRQLRNSADVDNLCKFVLDAVKGVLYVDDKQVIEVNAKKRVSTQNKITMVVRPAYSHEMMVV